MIDSHRSLRNRIGARLAMQSIAPTAQMHRSVTTYVIAMVVVSTASASAQVAQSQIAGSEALPPPHVALHLQARISVAETERYCRIADLSDAQSAFLQELYTQYLTRVQELEDNQLPELNAQSGTVAAAFIKDKLCKSSVDSYAELWHHEQAFKNKCVSIENVIFDELSTVLADSQMPALERIRWHRQRARCSRLDRDIPAARIDLSSVLEPYIIDANKQVIEPILLEYETVTTPIFVDLDRSTAQ